jgi:hypothetical protein
MQTSQVTYTVGKKCISTATSPLPWHASQRPPFTLKRICPVPSREPRLFRHREHIAYMRPAPGVGGRIASRRAPIGDWSMRDGAREIFGAGKFFYIVKFGGAKALIETGLKIAVQIS